jgi:hypothetical protein
MRRLLPLLLLLLAFSEPAAAQWSLGPQVGGLGVGGSITKKTLFGFLSVSEEFSFAPVGTTNLTLRGVEYVLEPKVSGSLLFLNLHPFRGSFALGAGFLVGGYSADAATPDAVRAYVLGDQTYLVEDYGALTGTMKLKGPVPAFMMGWRGSGFNFGVGVALTEPDVELSAAGALATDPAFLADMEKERQQLLNALQVEFLGLRGIPLVRLGWELGL